jgi:hypothetical protein
MPGGVSPASNYALVEVKTWPNPLDCRYRIDIDARIRFDEMIRLSG